MTSFALSVTSSLLLSSCLCLLLLCQNHPPPSSSNYGSPPQTSTLVGHGHDGQTMPRPRRTQSHNSIIARPFGADRALDRHAHLPRGSICCYCSCCGCGCCYCCCRRRCGGESPMSVVVVVVPRQLFPTLLSSCAVDVRPCPARRPFVLASCCPAACVSRMKSLRLRLPPALSFSTSTAWTLRRCCPF